MTNMVPKVLFENDGSLVIEDIHMGMAKVGRKEYNRTIYAIMNKEGVFVTDCKYDIVSTYSEGYVAVGTKVRTYSNEQGIKVTKAKFGLVDMNGKEVVPLIYQHLGICKEGLINARKDGKWGFISPDGEVKIPFIYDEVHHFSEGLASVKKDGKYGFIDNKGNVVIDFKYIWTHDFSDGLCFVQCSYASADSSLTYINKEGKIMVTITKDLFGKYGMPSDYNEGMMILNRYKAVTKDGNIRFSLNNRYRMRDFSKGISCVYDSKTDKYGCVDTNGKFVVPCKYDKCFPVSDMMNGDAFIGISDNKKWGMIDADGTEIIPPEYNSFYGYSDGRILATKGNSIYSIQI